MILKIIFLSMLCIPIGLLQVYLIGDAFKDLSTPKKNGKGANRSPQDVPMNKHKGLRVAK